MSSAIVPISEIKKRKSSSEAYRDAYETPNPHENTGFSRRSRKIQIQKTSKLAKSEVTPEFAFEDFQAEPITKAIAKIPSQKMSDTAQKLLSKQKQSSLSRVSSKQMSTAKPRSEKSRRNYKKLFNDIEHIQDATFTEDFDEETPAVAFISASKVKSLAAGKKAKTKCQLAKVEPDEKTPEFVSDGFRIESSSAVKPAKKARTVNDRWLIDKAADELYRTVKVIGNATGKAAKATGKAVKAGLHEFNEFSELAVQNPWLIQIGKVH